jgi:hypothetical protein
MTCHFLPIHILKRRPLSSIIFQAFYFLVECSPTRKTIYDIQSGNQLHDFSTSDGIQAARGSVGRQYLRFGYNRPDGSHSQPPVTRQMDGFVMFPATRPESGRCLVNPSCFAQLRSNEPEIAGNPGRPR